MRYLLMAGGLLLWILPALAPMVHAQGGGGHGHGSSSSHGSLTHGEPEGQARPGFFHSEYINKPLAVMVGFQWYLFPAQPPSGLAPPFFAPGATMSGMAIGGPDALFAGQVTDHGSHHHMHHPHLGMQADQGQSTSTQNVGADHGQASQTGPAAAQPGLAAGLTSPMPPGAVGPGLHLPGLRGPGMPGPGQPTGPRF